MAQTEALAEDRERAFTARIQELSTQLDEARVRQRDAEEAFTRHQGKVSDLTDQLEVLRSALEEKDNEFQVIADALVEAEEAKAQLERERSGQSPLGSTALREENESLQQEVAKLRSALQAAGERVGTQQQLEQAVHSRDKEIESLRLEVARLTERAASEGGSASEGGAAARVAELEAELALSQRKLSRLEQSIIRLKGVRS